MSTSVLLFLVQPCHLFLGDNQQCPGLAQELLWGDGAGMGLLVLCLRGLRRGAPFSPLLLWSMIYFEQRPPCLVT